MPVCRACRGVVPPPGVPGPSRPVFGPRASCPRFLASCSSARWAGKVGCGVLAAAASGGGSTLRRCRPARCQPPASGSLPRGPSPSLRPSGAPAVLKSSRGPAGWHPCQPRGRRGGFPAAAQSRRCFLSARTPFPAWVHSRAPAIRVAIGYRLGIGRGRSIVACASHRCSAVSTRPIAAFGGLSGGPSARSIAVRVALQRQP